MLGEDFKGGFPFFATGAVAFGITDQAAMEIQKRKEKKKDS